MLFNQFPEYAFSFFHAGAPRVLRDTSHQTRFQIKAEAVRKSQCRFGIKAESTLKHQTRFGIGAEKSLSHQTFFEIYTPETVTN